MSLHLFNYFWRVSIQLRKSIWGQTMLFHILCIPRPVGVIFFFFSFSVFFQEHIYIIRMKIIKNIPKSSWHDLCGYVNLMCWCVPVLTSNNFLVKRRNYCGSDKSQEIKRSNTITRRKLFTDNLFQYFCSLTELSTYTKHITCNKQQFSAKIFEKNTL